jgi:hypothetical protein
MSLSAASVQKSGAALLPGAIALAALLAIAARSE